MIRAIGPFAVALLFAVPAAAQQVEEGPGGPDRVSLTVYNQNVALVEDVRNLTIHNPRVLTTRPWSHLSDHVPLSVEVEL